MDNIIEIGSHRDPYYFTNKVNNLFFELMDQPWKFGEKNEKTERMLYLEKEIERLRPFTEKEVDAWVESLREESI